MNFRMLTKPVTLVYPVCVSRQTFQAHKITGRSRITFSSSRAFVSLISSWPLNSPGPAGTLLSMPPFLSFGSFKALFTG